MINDISIFFFASTIMALGIGLDAAIATLVHSDKLSKPSKLYWVAGVSLTHTLFPMLGYCLAYFSIQWFPFITPIVGIIAFVFVFHFLYTELMQNNEDSTVRYSWISFAIILAVSWDALWSGPAKSAQVVGWSDWMIWLSFLWVGFIVSLLCVLSCILSHRLQPFIQNFPVVQACLIWTQYTVIGYFGLLAFSRYTLQIIDFEVGLFVMSGVLVWLMRRLNRQSWQSIVQA